MDFAFWNSLVMDFWIFGLWDLGIWRLLVVWVFRLLDVWDYWIIDVLDKQTKTHTFLRTCHMCAGQKDMGYVHEHERSQCVNTKVLQ